MNFNKLLISIIETLANTIGSGKESDHRSGTEIRAEFQRKLDRGETISDQELLAVPLHHVPAELANQHLEAQRNAIRPKKKLDGETISDRWKAEAAKEPARKLADDIKSIAGVPDTKTFEPTSASVRDQSTETVSEDSPPIASLREPSDAEDWQSKQQSNASDSQTEDAKQQSHENTIADEWKASQTNNDSETLSNEVVPASSGNDEDSESVQPGEESKEAARESKKTGSDPEPLTLSLEPVLAKDSTKPTIIEKWIEEAAREPSRSLAEDVATIGEATPEAAATAASEVSGSPVNPPASNPQPNQYPNFYHQRDPAGNTMAELLTARDGNKAGRGGRTKVSIKRDIKTWANHFDAQKKGAAQRPDFNSPDPSNEVSPASQASKKTERLPKPRKEWRQSQVVKEWKQSQLPAADGTPPVKGINGDPAATVKAAGDAQDKISQGGSQPKQVETSTPLPGEVVDSQKANQSDNAENLSRESVAADSLQLGLDVVGTFGDAVIPGSGIAADGANAAISVGRMFTDPARAGEHAKNAAISTVSMIPFIGDTAKLLKAKRVGKTVRQASAMAKGGAVVGAAGGAELVAKRKRREQLRDGAKSILGDGSNVGGGSGGGNEPPTSSPPGSSGDDYERTRKAKKRLREESRLYQNLEVVLKKATTRLIAFTGALGLAIAGAWKYLERRESANDNILSRNSNLAQYNGKLGEAYAKNEAATIERGKDKAAAIAGPTARLSSEQNEIKTSMDSIRNPIEAMGIEISAFKTSVVNSVNEHTGLTSGIASSLEYIAGLMGAESDKERSTGVQSFFQDLSDGKFDGHRPEFSHGKAAGRERIIKDNDDHNDVFRK